LSRDHSIRFAIAARMSRRDVAPGAITRYRVLRRRVPDEHGVSRAESGLRLVVVDRLRAPGLAGVGT
jgi:hypothetical protein